MMKPVREGGGDDGTYYTRGCATVAHLLILISGVIFGIFLHGSCSLPSVPLPFPATLPLLSALPPPQVPELSLLDNYLLSNQMSTYCDQLNIASTQALQKLYVFEALQK